MKEYQRKAKNKYKAKVETLRVELYPTDADIKEHLSELSADGIPKATYIKHLIRCDMLFKKFCESHGYSYKSYLKDRA